MIADVLRSTWFSAISADAVTDGLESARHPGRLEYLGQFLLDGAHNPAGARVLAEFLDEFEQRPITLVFGAMQGKDVAAMCEILFPRAGSIVITQPKNSRAMDVADILKLASLARRGGTSWSSPSPTSKRP